jgi:hypothetical protein
MAPEAWACLPGQGLRYLEHLCLVLEQMARLQQFYLQLQTERSHGVSDSQSRVTMPVSGGKGQDPWNCGCLQNSLSLLMRSSLLYLSCSRVLKWRGRMWLLHLHLCKPQAMGYRKQGSC